EDERRSPGTAPAAGGDRHPDTTVPPQHSRGRDYHRRPFAMTLPTQRFPGVDDRRIDADRRIVDEEVIVDLPDVHRPDASSADDGHGLGQVEWDPEIPGEMIQRAE